MGILYPEKVLDLMDEELALLPGMHPERLPKVLAEVRIYQDQFRPVPEPYDVFVFGCYERGFSHKTVHAFIDADIKLPEDLLVLTGGEVARIKGLGKRGMSEVQRYREKFLHRVDAPASFDRRLITGRRS